MRYFCTHFSSVLSLLFILSCLTVALALNSTQVEVMKKLSAYSSLWKYTSNPDPCQWDGVNCSENKADVVELHLSDLGFNASIDHGFNASIWQIVCKLQALQVLDLSKNFLLTPSEEDIRSCASLVSLNLSSSAMSGFLPSFNPLQKLNSLDMSYNKLRGGFADQIQNLAELKTFNVTDNNFDGLVAFGGLKLEAVDISHNNLTGEFPQDLIKLTNLTFLDLSGNHFSDLIPDNISSLAKLETLVLSINKFYGSIPKSLKALTKLSHLAMNQNELTGTIPDELSSIAGMESLDLSYNRFSGSIPSKVFSLSNLKSLDLTSNLLSGVIPRNFSRNLFRLRIGNNKLNGTIPSTVSKAPNLTYLEMNNNFLYGSIPEQLASCTQLQLLALGHNGLGGSLTEVLPKLLQLQYLKLPNNKFEGSILDRLSNLSNLTYVDLSDNLLTGSLSPNVFELKQLQNLRLQNNHLAGIIPRNIQDSKSLLELQLGKNYLRGTIPQGVGNLYMLQIALNLSHNFLEGKIPNSLSSLVALEILDLSNNRLTGEIQESLSEMKSLTVLNLSNNELTGSIPPSLKNNKHIDLETKGNPGLSQEQSSQSSNKKKNPSAGLLVGVAIAGAIFALGAVELTMFACKYLPRQRFNLSEAIRKILQKVEHPRISYEELLAATNRFHKSNLLATNSFGSVYKGVLTNRTCVAVKVLNVMHEESDKIFNAECKVLQKVRHRNIARIITTCSNLDFKALIFEFFSNGSLEKHLYQDSCKLGLKEVLNIAIDIAHAVEYLHHDCYVQMVHCDIKPSNVLLDEILTAHLSDFGISRLMGRTAVNSVTSTIDLRGSVGYIAPEYGLSGKISLQGDVYSYGILLLEMLTRRRPTDNLFDGIVNLHKWVKRAFPDRAVEVVDKSLLVEGVGQKNEECLISLIRVGLLCSGESPAARPTMRDVSNLLKVIQQDWTSDTTTIKLRPTISNLVCERGATLNCEDASDTQSSTF